MSIVRYRKGNKIYLYESTAEWDPVKKQSRPKRTYLGTEDPVTGELIPSSKKPGRKPSNRPGLGNTGEAITDYRSLYENCEKDFRDKLEKKDQDILALRDEIRKLKEKDRLRNEKMNALHNQMLKIAEKLIE